MIVLVKGSGNHSNRLLQHCHYEAFAMERNQKFYNPSLCDLNKYYSQSNFAFCKIFKYLKKFIIIVNVKRFDKKEDDIKKQLLIKPSINFVSGWYFREHKLVIKYHEYFKSKFKLKKKYYSGNNLYNKIESLKKNKQTLIAIHIRRGDYKYFKNGVYYYEDLTYRNVIEHFKLKRESNILSSANFIIFSDQVTGFTDTSDILVSRNPWYIDHFLMSLCDYIIGPPSSFSMWASFIGQVPLYHLKNDIIDFRIDEFRISDL